MVDYDTCVAHRATTTQRTLQNARVEVQEAYSLYVRGAGKADRVDPIMPNSTLKKAWQTNYSILDKDGALSIVREELLRNNSSGRCVFCACIPAGTLDHYLPQAIYSEFSAFALNLVPACDPCQRSKGTKAGKRPASQFLHAYYDHLPEVPILRASFQVTSSGRFLYGYNIDMAADCDRDLLERLAYQFKTLNLNERFRKEASNELGDRRVTISRLFRSSGAKKVREYLSLEASSVRLERGLHSWKTALLMALADEKQFPDSAIPAFLGP